MTQAKPKTGMRLIQGFRLEPPPAIRHGAQPAAGHVLGPRIVPPTPRLVRPAPHSCPAVEHLTAAQRLVAQAERPEPASAVAVPEKPGTLDLVYLMAVAGLLATLAIFIV